MIKYTSHISLRAAAAIGGLATLTMVVCAPFAELYAYPKLLSTNGAETIKNITGHQTLFALQIICYMITFICDIIAAWALYILLKPVNAYLSLLTALFRLMFATIAIASLLNLVSTFRILTNPELMAQFKPDQLQAQVMLLLSTFKFGFHFGLIFFGIYLCLLGYLVIRAIYIPWVLGICLIIAGLGYFTSSLQPYLFPRLT